MKRIVFILLVVASVIYVGCNDETKPAANCEIDDLTVSVDSCTSDSTYSLTINFKPVNATGDSFDMYIRNSVKMGTYHKNVLPVTIPNFKRSGLSNDYIKVCMKGGDCCKAIEFAPPSCDTSTDPCEIYDLVADVGACTSDSTYKLTVNFKTKNPTHSSFDLKVRNGVNIGYYKLTTLPLVIENFKRSGYDYDFIKVCINDNADCCKAIEFKPPTCETCEIYDLVLSNEGCTSDSTYKLKIDFKTKNPGNAYFDVYVRNGVNIGYYKIADLPIIINNFKKSGKDYDFVKVCVNDKADCCKAAEILSPSCK
ncbi:MAG: hypothetical protein H6607_10115 [Flavobacteriales bacterium]|nr:hypothetical protein [Flavobacteriales bacterium]